MVLSYFIDYLERDVKWLEIRCPATLSLDEDMDDNIEAASDHFAALLRRDLGEDRQPYFEKIQTCLCDASLPDWFALHIYVIFYHLHQKTFMEQNNFLDAIGSVHLIRLHHEVAAQYRDTNESLVRINKWQQTMFHHSSSNLAKLVEEGRLFMSQRSQLEERLSRLKQQTLARFYLIVKIVSMLGVLNEMSPDRVLVTKEEMLHRPEAFVGSIAAILRGLQGIDQGKLEKVVIGMKIDEAIKGLLKLIGFEGNNDSLVSSIKKNLFEKKYLSFVDASPVIPLVIPVVPLLVPIVSLDPIDEHAEEAETPSLSFF